MKKNKYKIIIFILNKTYTSLSTIPDIAETTFPVCPPNKLSKGLIWCIVEVTGFITDFAI
jgi:hypothetical protein